MPIVKSKDGTTIAFDKYGTGPVVILVNGTVGYRQYHGDLELAQIMANNFTAVAYDRRGRGESTDTIPYTIEREIDDIEALIDALGGQGDLYGVSTGGALVLKAAIQLKAKIRKIALFEPPWLGEEMREIFLETRAALDDMLAQQKLDDALSLFMQNFMSPDEVKEFQSAYPDDWKIMKAIAPTLAYDYALLDDGVPPTTLAVSATRPVLLIEGSEGLPYAKQSLRKLLKVIPNARLETLHGQHHEPDPKVIAEILTPFFLANKITE